jgi:hypothetical protein
VGAREAGSKDHHEGTKDTKKSNPCFEPRFADLRDLRVFVAIFAVVVQSDRMVMKVSQR